MRIGMLLSRFSVPLLPKPQMYTLRSATPASSTQFPPFFEEIENMHMAHDVLHQ